MNQLLSGIPVHELLLDSEDIKADEAGGGSADLNTEDQWPHVQTGQESINEQKV